MQWPEHFRAAVTAVLLAALLAACTNTPRPFRPAPGMRSELVVPPGTTIAGAVAETPEYVVMPPIGPSADVAGKLAVALAVALREHGIAATATPTDGTKQITATVQTVDADPNIAINIVWMVAEQSGDRRADVQQRVVGNPQEWISGDDRLISRVASQAAFRIGRQLGRGDLAHVPIAALPDLGPDAFKPSPGSPSDSSPEPGEPGAPRQTASAPASVAPASRAPRVRVLAVSGAAGGREMTAAMRRALGESQMVLVNSDEPGVFQVQGGIELEPAVEGRQRIVIRWIVKRADGTQIGDLEQANTVRAGALQGNWDKLAPIVALAAVDAIVELIERDRARGTR